MCQIVYFNPLSHVRPIVGSAFASLSSGPSPSLCLSAASFDAMAAVLVTLLDFCVQQARVA
jgi:hypothetical protein